MERFNNIIGHWNSTLLIKRCCLFIVILQTVACTNNQNSRKGFMANLDQADSLELIWFRTPDSPRYFTYLPTKDRKIIGGLVNELQRDTVPEISCMKEGKIYLFKNGEIFNTVFFGYADPDCQFLRFIRNGRLYYYSLSPAFKAQLIENKALAKEPLSPGKVDSTSNPGGRYSGI